MTRRPWELDVGGRALHAVQGPAERGRTAMHRAATNCCQNCCQRWYIVKRTTVKLPDDLDARLRHEAERREMTVSELTREAIETHLVGGGKRMLGAAGHSGRSDIAHRIEEIIRSELAAR